MIANLNFLVTIILFFCAGRIVNGASDLLQPEQPSPWTPLARIAATLSLIFTAILIVGTVKFENFDQFLLNRPNYPSPYRMREGLLFVLPPIGVLFVMSRFSLAKRCLGFALILYPLAVLCWRLSRVVL